MFSNYTLSIHAREDRPERITEILVNVGLGQPILRVPHEDKKDCFYYLTSTGVLVIASPVKKEHCYNVFACNEPSQISLYKSRTNTHKPKYYKDY